MEELLERCCGLDVHKDTIVACIRQKRGQNGVRPNTVHLRSPYKA